VSIFGALAYTVSSSATLGGYSAATFDMAAQGGFVSGVAGVLGVSSNVVSVTGVTDAPGRRRLTASGVQVAFSVTITSKDAATRMVTRVEAVAAAPASLVAALQSSGLTALTGVVVAAATASDPTAPAVNVSAISNITLAVEEVAAQLSGAASAADAATLQGAILLSLNASVAGNQSATQSDQTATLVLAVVNATARLDNATQNAALDVLGTIVRVTNASGTVATVASAVLVVVAGSADLDNNTMSKALDVLAAVAGSPVAADGNGTAQTITDALSCVATTAVRSNSVALAVVQGVVDMMISSQASTLVAAQALLLSDAAPLEPLVTQSPMISTHVQVDQPGSARLSSVPLTFPNSPSAFEPMPAGLLAGVSTSVITEFMTLAFNPYASDDAGSGSNFTTEGGVTRLAFSSPDGVAITVANASTPIRFTLPAVNLSAAGAEQAACAFWDPAASAYSGAGCVALPNPFPPNSSVFFTPDFTAASDADMSRAWDINFNFTNSTLAVGCSYTLLDCAAEPAPSPVYPDPRAPLQFPAVACPDNVTQPPVLRVYYGASCALWRQDNGAGCYWDNALQAFRGDACVRSVAPTHCACRHLTDFAAARVPTIQTCSLNDLVDLKPGDIVTKLKFLFGVVVSLFGFMNAGAAVAFFQDAAQRRATLAALQRPEAGFREMPGGVWLWSCEQAPLDAAVAAPRGSALELAAQRGLPYVRLRAALPEQLMPGAVGQALGRRNGLSLARLTEAQDDHDAVMAHLVQALPCCVQARGAHEKIPRTVLEGDEEQAAGVADRAADGAPMPMPSARWCLMSEQQVLPPAVDSEEDPSRLLAGTALVFAFMANAHTLPVAEHARRAAAARAFFGDARAPGIDHGFDALLDHFLVMLSEDNLTARDDWLEKARLWRFALLQLADGGWAAPSSSLAFALQAREGAVPPRSKSHVRWHAVLGALLAAGGGDGSDAEEELDDAVQEALRQEGGDDAGAAGVQAVGDATAFVSDCTLTFSVRALAQRMPDTLKKLNARWEAADAAAAARSAAEARECCEPRVQVGAELQAASYLRERLQLAIVSPTHHRMHMNTVWASSSAGEPEPDVNAAAERRAAAKPEPAASTARDCTPAVAAVVIRAIAAATEVGQRTAAAVHEAAWALPTALLHTDRRGPLSGAPVALITAPLSSPPSSLLSSPSPSSRNTVTMSRRRARARPRVPVERIWTTLLALSALADSEVCLLAEVPEEEGTSGFRSIVDAGHAFLAAQASMDKRVRKLLARGTLQMAAAKARRDWGRIQAANVEALRETDAVTRFTALSHAQRSSARVVRSLMVDHSMFATFLDTSGYIMRWQRFMIVITLLLSTLLVSIWFYSSRGAQCCAELRALLDAGAGSSLLPDGTCAPHAAATLDAAAPPGGCPPGAGLCLGFAGNCADVQAQFADLQGCYTYGDPGAEEPHETLADYVCHTFPDDAYITDQLFVGLISVAVALPVDMFLQHAFEIANEVEFPETWLDAPPGTWKLLLGANCHHGWRLADPAVRIRSIVLWLARERREGYVAAVLHFLRWLLRQLKRTPEGPPSGDDDDAPAAAAASSSARSSGSGALAEARADALAKRAYAAAGLAGVYFVWTIFSWFIFTYGMLVYKQLGPSAEGEFAKTWGIGFGLDNASEWRDVLQTAVQAALVVVVLDALRWTSSEKWFEEHIDFMSMQCSLYAGAARGWWAQTRTLIKLQARLTD
jgi:hypothetical protein